MENASKALLIAGAILIVIVLIGIGVIVVNSTNGMQEQASSSADSMAIQTFNSQFTAYEGDGMSASQVRNLISIIKASNATNPDKEVTIVDEANLAIKSGKKYVVDLGYDKGYVKNVTITEAK